jgi:hypothetical protein
MKFPAVPRTGDIFLLYRSLTQRSASMGTRIVESIEAAIEVKKGNASILDLQAFTCARGNVLNIGDRHIIEGHGSSQKENPLMYQLLS